MLGTEQPEARDNPYTTARDDPQLLLPRSSTALSVSTEVGSHWCPKRQLKEMGTRLLMDWLGSSSHKAEKEHTYLGKLTETEKKNECAPV